MAYAAVAFPSGHWPSGLPHRLDALISALLRVQVAESAEADPYPRTPDLRIVRPIGSRTRALAAEPPAEPEHEPEDEPGRDVLEVHDDTRDLVRQAQGGDAEAFGALYDRYVDLVHRYVYYRVGSQALAEDLTSETFLRALRRISSYTWQGVDIGAWFVTIARNLVADHYKSGRYRLEVQVHEVRDDRTADGPEDEVLDALDHRVLLEAVTKLGAEQQECIVLRFLQGLSVSETAAVMGKNDGAVKALQYRAVRSLSRLLPAGFVR
ncbi:MAG: polymerase sigma-70 factor, subfamily [Frankiales bacterium]|nr:polymerase sigma-70 factor, subfamily [Frankiales bacterium]MDX6209106.1 polymerase sigma-70 factor, subfamily [Frankiales bacterium]MDX6212276.1 polymerase sigma-70 factor, subfamily [Frankiales bacterium]MDX6222405.1 polymerase sigma-70 factor, subfamily [Frankiales bacterium]